MNSKRKEKMRFTERQCARIIYQLIMVLKYLHANNLVHRDIKPENILFRDAKGDIIKVIDFGTCARINNE